LEPIDCGKQAVRRVVDFAGGYHLADGAPGFRTVEANLCLNGCGYLGYDATCESGFAAQK
jgi:hypothetical protein